MPLLVGVPVLNRRALGLADAIGLPGAAAPVGLLARVDEYGFEFDTAFIADGPIVLSALTPPTPDAGRIFMPAAVGLWTGAFWTSDDERTGVELMVDEELVRERAPRVLDEVGVVGAPTLEVVGVEDRRERETGDEAGTRRGGKRTEKEIQIHDKKTEPAFARRASGTICICLSRRTLPSSARLSGLTGGRLGRRCDVGR